MTVLHCDLKQSEIDRIKAERKKLSSFQKAEFMKDIITVLRSRDQDLDDVSEEIRELPLTDGRVVQYVKEVIPVEQRDEKHLVGLQDTLAFVARAYKNGLPDVRVEYRNHPATNKRFIGTDIIGNVHVDNSNDACQIAEFIFDRLRDEDYLDLQISYAASIALNKIF